MCLITCLKEPLIASEDIPVFKKLEVNKEGVLITPYRGIKVNLEEEFIATGEPEKIGDTVGQGFIHSYITPPDTDFGVWAIIPKGTPFFISNNFKEICSEKIRFTKSTLKSNYNIIISILDSIAPNLEFHLPLPIIESNWFTANYYCRINNCKFPTIEQLKIIQSKMLFYNILRLKNGLNLLDYTYFWSSEVYDSDFAYNYHFYSGKAYYNLHNNDYYVVPILENK